ncbi:MAG: hypothetical protein D6714_13255, partial [Bacteroidetes bacterium]
MATPTGIVWTFPPKPLHTGHNAVSFRLTQKKHTMSKWPLQIWDTFSGILFPRLCPACQTKLPPKNDLIWLPCTIKLPKT